jgi:flavodoxin
MKKLILFSMLTFSGVLIACAQGASNTTKESERQNILIAYFSRTGNTETAVKHIQTLIGGELFEIKTVTPYPSDYNACLAQATAELNANSRPALATHVSNMSAYDVIFIAYPIWWGDTPMAIRSFLEEYDLSGKTVIPFCTSGSSGINQSVRAIRNLCPKSKLLEGICITNSNRSRANELVKEWIDGLDIVR